MSQALKFVPVAAAFFSGCSSDDSSSSSCTWTKETTTIELKVEADKVTAISSLKCGTANAYTDTTKLAALFTAKGLKDKDCAAAKTLLENNTLCADPIYVSLVDKVGKDDKMTAVRAKFANIAATTFTLESKCIFGSDTTATDNTPEFNKNFLNDKTRIFKKYGADDKSMTVKNAIDDLKETAVASLDVCGFYVSQACSLTLDTGKTITVSYTGKVVKDNLTVTGVSATYCASGTTDVAATAVFNNALNGATGWSGLSLDSCTDETKKTAYVTSVKALMSGSNNALVACGSTYCTPDMTIGGAKVKLYLNGGNAYVYKVDCSGAVNKTNAKTALAANALVTATAKSECPAAGTISLNKSGGSIVEADFCPAS